MEDNDPPLEPLSRPLPIHEEQGHLIEWLGQFEWRRNNVTSITSSEILGSPDDYRGILDGLNELLGVQVNTQDCGNGYFTLTFNGIDMYKLVNRGLQIPPMFSKGATRGLR